MTDTDFPIFFGEPGHSHFTKVEHRAHDYLASCVCGAEWTYGLGRDESHMHSIWESHLRYFSRPPTQVL